MPNISVKDVPQAWAEALRQRAARNHRSLQGELMAIIEQAAKEAPAAASTGQPGDGAKPVGYGPFSSVVGQDCLGHPVTRRGWNTFEQWMVERRQMYPEPMLGLQSGTDIIRQDRDSR